MSDVAHSTRAHKEWAASATARNWHCPGAIAMATITDADRESIHSARGTAAHEIAEECLQSYSEAIDHIGRVIDTKSHRIEIDEELAASAQTYVDYVRGRISETSETILESFGLPIKSDRSTENMIVLIEKQFDLSMLDPPFDAGGTCDVVLIWSQIGVMEAVDFKNGSTVVSVDGNKQLRTYALAALLNTDPSIAKNVTHIKSTIVQPRARHENGRIRSESYHVADLILWGGELLDAMRNARRAKDEFDAIADGNRVLFDDWAARWLRPGACAFCPAEGICPARRAQALAVAPEEARGWLDDVTLETPPNLRNAPQPLSLAELGHTLDGLEALEDWIKAVRAHAHAVAEAGAKIPGWRLADKIGNRAWKDESAVVTELAARGLTESQIWKKTLISPAQADKLLGKRKNEIADLFEKPIRGTNLVSEEKTTRPETTAQGDGFVEVVTKEI